MSGRKTGRRSRSRVLLAAVPLAVVLLAPVPGSASAPTGGDACEGKLTGVGRQASGFPLVRRWRATPRNQRADCLGNRIAGTGGRISGVDDA